jgi:hypothetical protein
MWEYLKKEFKAQSDNCTLSKEGDEFIFTDRPVDNEQP